MRLLTFFPPTFCVDSLNRSNGSNSALFAYYDNSHEFGGAIGVQEVYEARLKAPTVLGLIALTIAAIVVLDLNIPTVPQPALIGLASLFAYLIGVMIWRLPSLREKLELTGQAVECVVRSQFYMDTSLEDALDDAARQLGTHYAAFKELDDIEIFELIEDRVPAARRWVADNQRMVTRAVQWNVRG